MEIQLNKDTNFLVYNQDESLSSEQRKLIKNVKYNFDSVNIDIINADNKKIFLSKGNEIYICYTNSQILVNSF